MARELTRERGITPLLDSTVGSLARELAMDIQDTETILRHYGMNRHELDMLLQDRPFQRLLESAIREWNSAFTTAERVKVKAQAMIENALEGLHAACVDEKTPLSQRIEGLKFTSRLAGLLNEKGDINANASGGKGFAVTINIGRETVRITQAPEAIEADAA